MSAGTLVPVELPAVPTPAISPAPNNGAPPVDPFAAASQQATAAQGVVHSALSSGVHAAASSTAVQSSSSRPQPPQSPGQIILEWSKPAEVPVVGYSSAPTVR
ncbi:MAG: hypothetical protein QM775_01745 [Pirellulales bacterium]